MQLSDDFIGQRQRRIEKIHKLKELGINPYPAHAKKEHNNKDIVDNYNSYENKSIVLSGRLMSWRDHGKLMFADLQDQSGKIQLWLKKDDLHEELGSSYLGWEHRNLLDVGDFVEVHGTVTKTISGQISLLVKHLRLLSKTIRPFPNSLENKEIAFRRRYLDLTLHPEHKDLFIRKAKFWDVSRKYMKDHGFLEVEVPVLEHLTGGADARPFVTVHNELNQEFYLRISTELYQKRLIGAGFEKIFTIGPNFRNEGLSDEHLQEYSQLEWYWAYADYRDNMNYVKDLFRHVAKEVYGKTTFETRGHKFDLADEWEEIDYVETIKQHHGIDIFEDSEDKMKEALKKAGVELPGAVNKNRLIDNLWKVIRKTLSGPAFLVNEPKFMSPLAKSKPENEELTERFHIVLGGSELGNGYSEINDPIDQLDRFLDQQKMRDTGDDEAQMLDIDFVEMLEYGMPPTSGYAHSERLFWFLENVTAREGTLFPQLKHEIDPLTKEVYAEITKKFNISLEKPPLEAGKVKKSAQVSGKIAAPAQEVNQTVIPQHLDTNLTISRDDALKIVNDHITNKNLVKHCISVEGAMRSLARYFNQNEDVWGLTGLMHDADWEETANDPKMHTHKTVQWLKEAGENNESVTRAILAHNYEMNTDIMPMSQMEWSLCCCDELTGLITASALITPEKKLSLLTIPSILKKFKSKNFAVAVKREHIEQCNEKLGIPLEEFIQIVLTGMQDKSDELGL